MKNLPVIVVTISLLLISMLVTAGAGAVAPVPADQPLQIVTRGPVGDAPQKVWTAEEMENAIPYPLPQVAMPLKDGAPVEPDGPLTISPGSAGMVGAPTGAEADALAELGAVEMGGASPTGYSYPPPYTRFGVPWNYQMYPFRTLGKVFFTSGGYNYVCSGSVGYNRMIWTAGHCVYDNYYGTWHTNWVFVPAYRNGAAPYGQWTQYDAAVLTAYSAGNSNSIAYDYAAVIVNDRYGRSIGSTVGYLGYMANASRTLHWMDFGYPAASPFAGQYLHLNAASHARDDGNFSPNPIGIGTDMTGGCSGGPWIYKFDQYAGAFNYVNGVNSYKYINPNQPYQIYSPYFGSGAVTIFDWGNDF